MPPRCAGGRRPRRHPDSRARALARWRVTDHRPPRPLLQTRRATGPKRDMTCARRARPPSPVLELRARAARAASRLASDPRAGRAGALRGQAHPISTDPRRRGDRHGHRSGRPLRPVRVVPREGRAPRRRALRGHRGAPRVGRAARDGDPADVYTWFSGRTGVPTFLLQDAEELQLADTIASLRRRLVRQDEAVERVAQLVGVVKAPPRGGGHDPNRHEDRRRPVVSRAPRDRRDGRVCGAGRGLRGAGLARDDVAPKAPRSPSGTCPSRRRRA